MREWLHTLPCVKENRVRIDVRGSNPVAWIGFSASIIRCKDDMYMFVALNLD